MDFQSLMDKEPNEEDVTEGAQAVEGEGLEDTSNLASSEEIIEALQEVYDPEIPVNLYDLGLIYDFDIQDNGNVNILMTLTTPSCPVAGEMPRETAKAVVNNLEGKVGKVSVTLTWEPPWSMEKMSEDALLALGLDEILDS